MVAGIKDGSTVVCNLTIGTRTAVEGEVIGTGICHGKKYYKYCLNKKYGYYDETFKSVIPPKYNFLSDDINEEDVFLDKINILDSLIL